MIVQSHTLEVSDHELLNLAIDDSTDEFLVVAATIRRSGQPACWLARGNTTGSDTSVIWHADEVALLCPTTESEDVKRPCIVLPESTIPTVVFAWLRPLLDSLQYTPSVEQRIVADAPDEMPFWWFRIVLPGRGLFGAERYTQGLMWVEQPDKDAPEVREIIGSSQLIDKILEVFAPEQVTVASDSLT